MGVCPETGMARRTFVAALRCLVAGCRVIHRRPSAQQNSGAAHHNQGVVCELRRAKVQSLGVDEVHGQVPARALVVHHAGRVPQDPRLVQRVLYREAGGLLRQADDPHIKSWVCGGVGEIALERVGGEGGLQQIPRAKPRTRLAPHSELNGNSGRRHHPMPKFGSAAKNTHHISSQSELWEADSICRLKSTYAAIAQCML